MNSSELERDGFNQWYDFNPQVKTELLSQAPASSGVYTIRAPEPFGRFQGRSDIVYFGCTVQPMRMRIRPYFTPGTTQATNQRINKLMNTKVGLQISFSVRDRGTARDFESELIERYKDEHGELPPYNRSR